jgi:hypothetical protein
MKLSIRESEIRSTRRRFLRSIWLTLCLGGLLVLLATLSMRSIQRVTAQQQSPQKTADEISRMQMETRRQTFESGRQLLLKEHVPFEPNQLLAGDWREKLAPAFAQMPEMQTVRYGEKSLQGVQLANTLYLPEKITLTGDTVILARHLIFEGTDVVIKGNYDIHIYSIETIGLLGTTLRSAHREPGVQFSRVSFNRTALPRGEVVASRLNRGRQNHDRH